MPHCSITIDTITCLRAREAAGDKLWLEWAFYEDGSPPQLNRRPHTGYWSLPAGGMQPLNDPVVDQSIFPNQLYWFELELGTDDTGLSFAERVTARVRRLMRGWGGWSIFPGAGELALLLALFGVGGEDVRMGHAKVPVQVMAIPDQPPTGTGLSTFPVTGQIGNTQAVVVFKVVTT